MPMLMRGQRLDKAGALFGREPFPVVQQTSLGQHPVHARRADGHQVGIQHHKRQPPVAFQGILLMEADDGLFLPVFQPVIARGPYVMLVDFAVAFFPVEKLAARQAGPGQQPPERNLSLLGPAVHKIHNLVAQIMRHPFLSQLSPRLFFSATCSSINSARTSFLRVSFSSSALTFRSKAVEGFSLWFSNTILPRSKNSCCHR